MTSAVNEVITAAELTCQQIYLHNEWSSSILWWTQCELEIPPGTAAPLSSYDPVEVDRLACLFLLTCSDLADLAIFLNMG